MNPNVTIRTWLLACGAQYGIRQAHEYRWPDADTRPHEMYCTYRSLQGAPENFCISDLTTGDGSTYLATRRGAQGFLQTWKIDLYNSQDGLAELEAFCIAANHSPAIRKLFDDGGCSFAGIVSITNETQYDQAEINYHFVLTCLFRENVEISLDELNGVVETIAISLENEAEYGHLEIDENGITVIPATP